MSLPKLDTVNSLDHLRGRISDLLQEDFAEDKRQVSLGLSSRAFYCHGEWSPRRSVKEFLDFLTDAVPDGDVYLFGGVLRDMALYGRRGFKSDIDLVVEGDWNSSRKYIESIGAQRNKFGGYRLQIGRWPIDIWNARETWAVSQRFVRYEGVASLTKTTVLNWDAILMNWRTKSFVHEERYLEQLRKRILDVVLLRNPDPLGMAVRVFRHLILKDAVQITPAAAQYLVDVAQTYSFQELRSREIKSYGKAVIERKAYRLFAEVLKYDELDIRDGLAIVSAIMSLQQELDLH